MYLKASLFSLSLILPAFAQQPEKPNPPETLVIRFHKESKKMEILESNQRLVPVEDVALQSKEFKSVEVRKPVHELDRDSSTNSGYGFGFYGGYSGYNYSWGFNYYYAPTYYPTYYPYNYYYPVYANTYCCAPTYYYGGYAYNYAPYYYYNYGPYVNYYYRPYVTPYRYY